MLLQAALRKKTVENTDLFRIVDDIVKWKTPPAFMKMGRTAWLPLREPVRVEINGTEHQVNSLKIKGVGLCDHLGRLHLPTANAYYRIHPHLGFTKTGDLIHISSDPSPLGGIVFKKALNEFEIAHQLAVKSCPTEIPLYLYEYMEPELSFKTEQEKGQSPLGVVISGLPDKSFVRFDTALCYSNTSKENQLLINQWSDCLGLSGVKRQYSLLSEIAQRYGRTLRSFHKAGFYRYSGQPDNYSFSTQTRQVFLIDLDTSRRISECSEIETPLQFMRDIASGLYGITAYALRKVHISNYTPVDLSSYGILESLLKGYFDDCSYELLNWVSRKIDSHFLKIYKMAVEIHKSVSYNNQSIDLPNDFQEYRHQTIKQYWINRDESLCFFLVVAWILYENSCLADVYPLPYPRQQLYENIAHYSSKEISTYIQQSLEKIQK